MLAEGIPRAIETAAQPASGRSLEVIDQTSMSLSMHVMEQTIADLKAEASLCLPSIPGRR